MKKKRNHIETATREILNIVNSSCYGHLNVDSEDAEKIRNVLKKL